MMFAAGRVAPALRGRQSCRTNDRSRPTARRTSSGRARGSRASNKPCPRASLLHRVPNKRNRVDARAFGREWFLEKWLSEKFCCRVHREVILKVRRTIFPHDFTMYATLSHSSFLTWLKVVFWDGRRLADLLGQVGRLLRHGARRAGERAPCLEITQRQLRTPWPAGRRPR
jgi:hypothetical protein